MSDASTPLVIVAFLLGQLGIDQKWSTRVTVLINEKLPPTGRHPAEMGLPEGRERQIARYR